MGLIKSNDAPPTLSTFSMRDVETHAKQVILRAQAKAEQMLAATQEQAEQLAAQIKEDAYQEGLADGKRAGAEEGIAAGKAAAIAEFRDKFESAIEALTQLVADFERQRVDFETQAFTDVIELAVSIARRVTQRQGTLQPEILTENVRQAVRLVAHQSAVTLIIHSTQKEFLDGMLPELRKSWPKVSHVELLVDDTVQPGGCRVSAGGCNINAELDRQIDRIVADLLPSEQTA